MSDIIALLLSGGLFGFLGALIPVLLSRRKYKAEVRNIAAETDNKIADLDLKRIEAQEKIQHQLDEARRQIDEARKQIDEMHDENKKLFADREIEREAKEKLRTELNRMHDRLELMGRELQTVREEKSYIQNELEKQKQANIDKTIRIEGLEAMVLRQGKSIETVDKEIITIKSNTGSLGSRK